MTVDSWPIPDWKAFRKMTITEREFWAERLESPRIREFADRRLLLEVALWQEWQQQFPVHPQWRRHRIEIEEELRRPRAKCS